MKKMKQKVFGIIFSIMTIMAIAVLAVNTITDYYEKERNIRNLFNRQIVDEGKIKDYMQGNGTHSKNDGNIVVDYDAYTVILDVNGDVYGVIAHNGNNTEAQRVIEKAKEIVLTATDQVHIGNLYFDDYSYCFTRIGTILVVDNRSISNNLFNTLTNNLIVVLLLEVVFILVAKKLTEWVCKPVEENFERQKQFIADASHELKTPIAVLLASADAYKADHNPKWMDNMVNEADRMNELVKDLLDLSSIENQKNTEMKQEDLSSLVEATVLTLEPLFYEAKKQLDYKVDENISFNCDNRQMKQLMTILLDNACKYSSEKVNVSLKKENKDIVLVVSNDGEPISKLDQERIFERFYKSDASRTRTDNNYGLGLAIAKSIVENHKGTIAAANKDGFNIFTIKFNA